MINKTLIFILFFFYIAPSKILGLNVVLIISIMSLTLLPIYVYVNKKISKEIIFFVSGWFFVCIIYMIISLYNSEFDFLLFKNIIYNIFIFLSSVLIVYFVFYILGDKSEDFIITSIIYISTIYAIIALCYMYVPPVYNIFIQYYDSSDFDKELVQWGIRTSGIFNGGYSIASVYYVIIIYLNLVYISVKTTFNKLLYITPLLLVGGVFVSGRLGLFYLLIVLLLSLLLPFKFLKIKKFYTIVILFFSCLILTVISVLYWSIVQQMFLSMFEIFINFYSGSGATTNTSNVLSTMWFLPKNIFIGNGVFDLMQSNISNKSDSGYIMMLNFGGMTFLITMVMYIFLTYSLVNRSNKIINNVCLFILLTILVGNMKDIYIFGISGITQVYFMLIVVSNMTDKKIL